MFYTETISYTSEKPSLFEKIIRAYERVGYLRAEAELKRLGYWKEAERVREQLSRL
jgi:hypothetical protein